MNQRYRTTDHIDFDVFVIPAHTEVVGRYPVTIDGEDLVMFTWGGAILHCSPEGIEPIPTHDDEERG